MCGKSDNAPRLRFPEFRGEWEEKRFSELFSFISNNTLSRAELSDAGEIKNIHYGDILVKYGAILSATDIGIPFVVNSKKIKKSDFLKDGDIIISDTAEDETVGKAIEIIDSKNIKLVAGLHTMACRPKLSFGLAYLGYYINSPSFHYQLIPLMQGIKVTSISKSNILTTFIRFPSLPEQKKIASFFTLLDRRIQKQRNLVESLKTYKRGVSEAIFERKFGFPNKTNWKKIKIENLFSERCERAIGNEELLAVTINGGIQKRNEIQLKDNSSEDKSNYKRVHIGDIAYNTMRMWQGASGVSCYAGIVSPAYTVIALKDKENQCIDFWGHYFKHTNLIRTFQKFSQGLTSDTWNLKYTQLSQINLYVPEYKEQCAIANFLHKFDSKISIEEKKLSQLSMLKNELLHRMFI